MCVEGGEALPAARAGYLYAVMYDRYVCQLAVREAGAMPATERVYNCKAVHWAATNRTTWQRTPRGRDAPKSRWRRAWRALLFRRVRPSWPCTAIGFPCGERCSCLERFCCSWCTRAASSIAAGSPDDLAALASLHLVRRTTTKSSAFHGPLTTVL